MTETVRSYHDLRVWKNGIELVKEVYKFTSKFPRSELYTLASQLQRAAVSVPSNIAEGQVRAGTKEFIQFLRISLGSCAEIETQMIIAHRLEYISKEELDYLRKLLDEMKQIRALIKQLSTKH